MNQCDLYVQPSRHEGYCITLAEAKLFNKPIVTTNFTGAAEQIIDSETGLIVEIEAEGIYKAVKRLLDEPAFRHALSNNLAMTQTQSTTDLDKLYELLET